MHPDSNDFTRCLRKNSKSHLQKYSSLPELQLVVKETALYHCYQCGFTNSFINPICLWCAWSCQEAQLGHEFTSSVPRARRASAPPRVFIKIASSLLSADHANIDSNRPESLSRPTESKSIINQMASSHIPVHHPSNATDVDLHRDRIDVVDTTAINNYYRQGDLVAVIPEVGDVVATATGSSSTDPLSFTLERTEHIPEHNSAMALTLSHGAFDVGRADKILSFHCDDIHEHAKNISLSHDDHELSPPAHPKHQFFRPLRRKNHLHIMPSPPNPGAAEPIAISLTLHHSSSPTSPHLGKKASQRSINRPQSSAASISSTSGLSPPLTPPHQQQSSPSPISSGPESSPVRLGHPSRPYYTAIRKNGISSTDPSRLRPQSQPPPSSFPASMTSTANASRHLSMSAMVPIPPAFSALYDGDDDDDHVNEDNNDYDVHSGPTNSARLSLSSSIHRVSYDNHAQTQTHTRSLSKASAKGIINRSHGIGFSMSGETELRMALAASSSNSAASPSATTAFGRRTISGDGFRFRETAVVPCADNSKAGSDYRYVGSKDSFMGRVKKLRKGLREMLKN